MKNFLLLLVLTTLMFSCQETEEVSPSSKSIDVLDVSEKAPLNIKGVLVPFNTETGEYEIAEFMKSAKYRELFPIEKVSLNELREFLAPKEALEALGLRSSVSNSRISNEANDDFVRSVLSDDLLKEILSGNDYKELQKTIYPKSGARTEFFTPTAYDQALADWWLQQHENNGGHTIREHVQKDRHFLRNRLQKQPHLKSAGTYWDKVTAFKTFTNIHFRHSGYIRWHLDTNKSGSTVHLPWDDIDDHVWPYGSMGTVLRKNFWGGINSFADIAVRYATAILKNVKGCHCNQKGKGHQNMDYILLTTYPEA